MPRFSPPTPEREEEMLSEEEEAYIARFRHLPQFRRIGEDPFPIDEESFPADEDIGQFDAQQRWYDEHLRQQEFERVQANRIGTAFHVHEAFENIRENIPEITETLGGLDPELDMSQDYLLDMILRYFEYVLENHYYEEVRQAEIEHINDRVKLDETLASLFRKFEGNLEKIPKILDKLVYIQDSISLDNISNMNTWLQFVMQQPDSFQANYVETFIGDTYNAYDGKENTISCVNGIIERLLLSIAEACLMHCTQFKNRKKKKSATKRKNDRIKNKERKKAAKRKTVIKGGRSSLYRRCDNPVYRKLIRLFKKEVPDINTLSQKWAASLFIDDYKQHTELGTIKLEQHRKKLAAMDAAAIEDNFVDFMKKEYKRYGITQTARISEKAEEYRKAQVFERKAFG